MLTTIHTMQSLSNRPLPANLIPVPLYRQQTDYSCGDASTLAVLRYWDWDHYGTTPESDLYGPLQTTEQDGTDPHPIEAFLNQQKGMSAQFKRNATMADLESAVDHRQPCIVDIEAWQDSPKDWATDWDDGHYVVLVGYDKDNLYFMDPSTDDQYAYIPKDQFMQRWHDVLGPQNEKVQHMMVAVQGSGYPHQATTVNPQASPIE